MRLRLFLSFFIVVLVTLLILGFVIRSETQSTITKFAQSGAFYGADRAVLQYETYYQQAGSWDQIDEISSMESHMNQMMGGSGNQAGNGYGNRQGAGQGTMFMGGADMGSQLTLTDANGTVLNSPTLTNGDQISSEVLEQSFPIRSEGEIVGYLIPDTGLVDLSEIISDELTNALGDSILSTALISGGIAILLAIAFAAYLMRPVRLLTGAADEIADGDLSQRVPVSGKDEIGQLARSFNQMADSLEQTRGARRAMTADIAHELRTPLAVQRANLEALQDGIYPLSQENLAPIIQQNQLLTKLVDDLRTLALADSGALELELTPTDLPALLVRITKEFQPQFEEQNISLVFNPVETLVSIKLDQSRFNQVINNLLQNSLRHTPAGGKVEIDLQKSPGEAVIQIKDSGEGIPEEALPRLFERFYRSDQSRSRDKGGTGLGLSIARQLVEAHGGTLTAANHPDGGAVFEIRLPKGV
jgi:two-component system sensor histidine kinase BaeS